MNKENNTDCLNCGGSLSKAIKERFQNQLSIQEKIIESDKAKRKAQQLKERKAQQRDKE